MGKGPEVKQSFYTHALTKRNTHTCRHTHGYTHSHRNTRTHSCTDLHADTQTHLYSNTHIDTQRYIYRHIFTNTLTHSYTPGNCALIPADHPPTVPMPHPCPPQAPLPLGGQPSASWEEMSREGEGGWTPGQLGPPSATQTAPGYGVH